MRYVDGFVLVVPTKKLKAYITMAKGGGEVWKRCGALEYMESIADDMDAPKQWGGLTFPVMTKARKTDTVIFSYIVFKSKKHRDSVNKKVHKEMEKLYGDGMKDMPFSMAQMAYGGFAAAVDC